MAEQQTILVPRTRRGYDFQTLRTRLQTLRARYPKLPPLWLRAEKDVPWWVVVTALDMARKGDGGQPLFPVVFLAPHEKLQEDES